MANSTNVRVGMVGTSWWADAMHLPALKNHPHADVVAICGRNRENAYKMAERWGIPHVYTDYNAMIDSGKLDAVVVSTPTDTHFPITMKALEAKLHVLTEKPMGLTYAETQQMADLAEKQGVKHLIPFTYWYMPTARYIKELIDGGYLGKPYHLNLRYYSGYGRSGDYSWTFDESKAGPGALTDIGSHFLFIARTMFGEITRIACHLGYNITRAPLNPEGKPYTVAPDNAVMMFEFANGAQGTIQVSTVCYEATPFGQTHHMEFHGSEGTLYTFTDWDRIQEVSGMRVGEQRHPLPIPDHIWNGARRDTVHNTYRDIFRKQDLMTRQFITAIVQNTPCKPDFHDGARVQRIIDAGARSWEERRWVDVDSVTA
jgi:predicted dehydrogenase